MLGRIFPYRYDTTPAINSGEEVWNADPTSGDVTIFVEPMAMFGSGKPAQVRATDVFKDLKIHLRLVAHPNKSIDDWTQDLPGRATITHAKRKKDAR